MEVWSLSLRINTAFAAPFLGTHKSQSMKAFVAVQVRAGLHGAAGDAIRA
jgi:hypothetical protein